ncbi:Hsp20/alpha crystallin family protein [Peribacillus sp. NPDC097264]|uniref:Hsp20/alpha crystallin family protein n=1 Tax=Peribacillus sp. NPDC097264 TaxID=3390616 RepID=UPI003D0526E5
MTPFEKNDQPQERKEPFTHFINKMDRLFSERPARGMLQSLDGFFGSAKEQTFPIYLDETNSEYILTASLPGIPRSQISIDLLPQSVTISTKSKVGEKFRQPPGFIQNSQSSSQLTKTISFLKPIDEQNVRARHRDGILTLNLPKVKGNRIEING